MSDNVEKRFEIDIYIYIYIYTRFRNQSGGAVNVTVHLLLKEKSPRTDRESPDGVQSYNSTLSLTSPLDRSGQHQAPTTLPPGKPAGTHCTGGWLGPRVGLDGCGISRTHRDSIPGQSSP